MDITVSFSHDESCAEVTLEDVNAWSPDVLADCFTRCVETILRWDVQQRILDGRVVIADG